VVAQIDETDAAECVVDFVGDSLLVGLGAMKELTKVHERDSLLCAGGHLGREVSRYAQRGGSIWRSGLNDF
jgi:hypothetical protein